MRGTFHKLWQVLCARCSMRSAIIQTHYVAEAQKQIRKDGWRTRPNPAYPANRFAPVNLWYCANCAREVKS